MFEYTDYSIDEKITKLELLKPNEQSLGEIINAKNKVTTFTLGGVSQLNFEIPDTTNFSNIMLNKNEVTDTLLNINVDEYKNVNQAKNALVQYLIRATYTNGQQIIYTLPTKNIKSNLRETSLSLQCYSREHELSTSIIVNYIGVPIDNSYTLDGLSLEEVLRDIMQDTLWEIDFLDDGFKSSDAEVIRRTVDAFNNISILATIDNLMSIFGGIPEYDTVNRKISVYKPDNYEHYKFNGLEINDYNYLKEIDKQEQSENMITRLYGLGKDGMTINAISPTGTSYLEDLSFFLYPAEMDSSENLIKSSNYMTDELALSELKYEKFLETQTGILENLFSQQSVKQQELTVLSNELYTLTTEQKLIQDRVDLKVGLNQANLNDTEYVSILGELDDKNLEIDNKNIEIDNKKAEIQLIIDEVDSIYLSLKLENHFTADGLKERQLYILEGLYTNTGIGIEVDLYDEMVEYLRKYNTPNITIQISAKDVFSMQTKVARKDRNRIKLGEQINLYYSSGILEIDIRAQIMEIVINEETNTMDLTIANILDYKKNSDEWIAKILQRNITTSSIVENNRVNWNQGKIAYDDIDQIYQQGIDAAKIEINSAVNNSVKTNERGITVTDTTNPLRFVRITNGVMALSKDGGRTFSTAISADGVWAEKLIGQILIGNELEIIGDGETLSIGNIPWDEFLDINRTDFGIVLKTATNTIFMTRERGFKITNPTGSQTKFYADTNGDLIANNLTVNNGTFTGKITSGEGFIGGFEILAAKIRSTNKNVGLSSSTWGGDPAFWAGNTDPWENANWGSNMPFYVTNQGYLKATNADISGTITATSGRIADYTISGAQLVGNNVGMSGTSGQGYAFWAGSNSPGSAPFRVGHDGSFVANNAAISGTVSASTISGSTVSGGTISGSYITGGTVNGSTVRGSNAYFGNQYYGGQLVYYNGSGYLSCGEGGTDHPYVSALNVALFGDGSGGISFRNGTSHGDTGSQIGKISMNSYSAMYIQSNGTININSGTGGNVAVKSLVCTGTEWQNNSGAIGMTASGGSFVWATGGGLSSGKIKTTSGDSSSRILKTNIEEFNNKKYDDALNLLKKIKIYEYDYKYNLYEDKHQYGFIIDDIEEEKETKDFFRFTEMLADISDGGFNPRATDDKDIDRDNLPENIIKYKEYNSDVLDKYLLTCIKSLQNKIEELEKKVNEGK